MLSIHSPDSVFTDPVRIFMCKTHNNFGEPCQCYKNVLVLLVWVTVHSSTTATWCIKILNNLLKRYVHTDVHVYSPTMPSLCLGTSVLRQKCRVWCILNCCMLSSVPYFLQLCYSFIFLQFYFLCAAWIEVCHLSQNSRRLFSEQASLVDVCLVALGIWLSYYTAVLAEESLTKVNLSLDGDRTSFPGPHYSCWYTPGCRKYAKMKPWDSACPRIRIQTAM